MNVLVDTPSDAVASTGRSAFQPATLALKELNRRGERLCVVPQVIYEFWVVCTRPTGENGLGLSVVEAKAEQAKVLSLFAPLPDRAGVFEESQRVVVQHDVKGKNAHDARIVAAMNVHGIGTILTFNAADFGRYPGLTVLAPQSFVAPPAP